ncbi:hypothetical protein ACFQ0F_06440 [Paraperlucidibaca wandonensis]|uniref:CDP-glycerol glycerophosphotransferase (TagB/SpsB family) n=1 Tax=Paraperlucidibaca wandonensis TaxID=1268273 RepID=A0ABW3HHK4_9GAMM
MIYVAFTKEDFICFSELISAEDIILAFTDCFSVKGVKHAYDVSDAEVNWGEQVALVRKFFTELSEHKEVDLNGYANNFFECSIRLSVQYIESLKLHSSQHCKVIFADRLFGKGRPNYYLSEHESQGQLMYNRKFALQSTVEKAVESLGLEIKYLSRKFNYQKLSNTLRDTAVFSMRLLQALRANLTQKQHMSIEPLEITPFYAVLRTQAQFFAVKQILESSTIPFTIICADTFVQRKLFYVVNEWACSQSLIRVVKLPEANFWLTIKTYLKTFYLSIKSCNKLFSGDGFTVNVKQACREVIIMSADLELYQNRLARLLPIGQNNSVFLTCEQKSPHAYTEINVAKNKGYRTIQVMACDQEANDLPLPAVADIFLTDTLKRKELFESRWSSKTSSLKYLGPIRLSEEKTVKVTNKNEFEVCYFSHVTEINQNKKIIQLLEKIKTQSKSFNYCIKVHPRDSGSWLKGSSVDENIVFTSSNITNDELYEKFKIAISNPSAVVMELLCHFKPFIFIDTIESYKNIDFVSCDEMYAGYTKSIDAIPELLSDKYDLYSEVRDLHARVFGSSVSAVSQRDLVSIFECRS